jgi:tetratricopeptide (TPR) repeat protein
LFARHLAPEHNKRLSNRENRAVMLAQAGRRDDALAELQAIADIRDPHPDPHLAFTLGEIGRLLYEMGRLEEAEDHFVRGLSVLQPIDPDHAHATSLLTKLGVVRVARGEPGSAVAPLERALELIGETADPQSKADAQFPLAQALAALGREPKRVDDLAREALATYRAVEPDNLAVAEVETFLRGRP